MLLRSINTTEKQMATPCKLWPGIKDRQGYGRVKIDGKMHRVHRVALAKKLGRKLLATELALHSCHTPACYNEDHLRVGTHAQNSRDRQERFPGIAEREFGDLNALRSVL
jgi:hypothetical protein